MDDETDPSKLFSVEGMVVVITGGATGLGLMMTKTLALNRARKVYIIGRRLPKLLETATLAPDIIVPLEGDITSKTSMMSCAARIRDEVGFVNLVCANAGVMPPPLPQPKSTPLAAYAAAALEQGPESWNAAFASNSSSVLLTTFAFLELLDAGNREGNAPGRLSQVLVTTSIAGYLRNPGANLGYGASKAAATHLVKHLSGTLAPYRVRVNGVAPGLFRSDLSAGVVVGLREGREPEEEGGVEMGVVPAERLGRMGDVAGWVLWLGGRAGGYVNGGVSVVDGGRVGMLPGTY